MTDRLRLEPHTIEDIVAICDTMLESLKKAANDAYELADAPSFGGFKSAEDLRTGFILKARGTPASLYERLEQFHSVLKEMRETFAAGGEGFLDAEYDWTQKIGDMREAQR
ncbi:MULTISPECIES: hypothetical protein [Rhodococcus]|uniref:hypothetical protein n=1 Tax=Rhodococcus TaxID=1827 RepID=UPI00081A9E21|nr:MULTISPECIES: hypothetical protein [Rhodococcus]ANZ25821.1 hypothetical protein A4U64_14945 [Rhodococcus sp. WB1]QIX49909.1 hypothetical protein HFP48_10290 [Rhodococcus sp. DMU1]QRI75022.1 hypothetical protein JQ505_21075 [Rhodococcus aetherivorans]QSE58431.1 hypothetical protein JYA75_22180 [Rhodococcus sp. PSBB066]QSE70248.1 hypothetical protein JYA91_05450 [Rhodococcus sp. PSBB049]